jgi:hypothetical protein
VQFQFSYHCFTDAKNKGGVAHAVFNDPDAPHENRVFCPQRWFLSQRLKILIAGEAIVQAKMAATTGYQWIWRNNISGISLPYVTYMKITPGAPNGPMIVLVNSAHIRADPQTGKGRAERFVHLLTETKKSGAIQGIA